MVSLVAAASGSFTYTPSSGPRHPSDAGKRGVEGGFCCIGW